MTELQLYKFIIENDVEWHWRDNNGTKDVIIFPNILNMEALNALLPLLPESGVECTWMGDYIAIWMRELCNHYGVDIDNVFTGEES